MFNSGRPHRWQPTRLLHPWDYPGKNNGVGCHLLLQCIKVKSESEVAQSYLTLGDPMDCIAYQAPPSMGDSRQEYWSGVPLPSPKCSLGISNFLEEISSLSHSVVFLYFFASIAEEGFFISPGYSLELCIQMGIFFLFSFSFHFFSFHSYL